MIKAQSNNKFGSKHPETDKKERRITMKKRLIAMLLAGAMCASIAGCSSDGGDDQSTPSGGETSGEAKYNVSVILKTTAAEYWKFVQSGAEAYAEEHPDQISVDVKGPPSETSFQEQLNMIQTDLSDDSYDGYIISPLQQDMVANLIADTAKPVIALDTNIESDKVLSFVGTGNEAAAKLGAIAAVEAAKEAGWETIQCIEIAGVQGDSTNTARMNGYQAGIEEAGGEFLENEVQYAEATATKAVDAMNGIISRHPEGIAIICANNDDMAIAAAKAARDSGNENYANTIFLGFNGDRAACEAILNDELTMSVAQMAYEMGYMSVEAMVKALDGEEIEPNIDSGSEVVTPDNAQTRLDTLDEQLGA